MYRMMTHESPGKILSLLGAAVISLFFMTAVSITEVSWQGSSTVSIADPFSPQNVVAFIDQAAWVYSDAAHSTLLDPFADDFALIADNLLWIKDGAEMSLAVAIGLADPLPQVSAPLYAPEGRVAGAVDYSPQYYDNFFSLMSGY